MTSPTKTESTAAAAQESAAAAHVAKLAKPRATVAEKKKAMAHWEDLLAACKARRWADAAELARAWDFEGPASNAAPRYAWRHVRSAVEEGLEPLWKDAGIPMWMRRVAEGEPGCPPESFWDAFKTEGWAKNIWHCSSDGFGAGFCEPVFRAELAAANASAKGREIAKAREMAQKSFVDLACFWRWDHLRALVDSGLCHKGSKPGGQELDQFGWRALRSWANVLDKMAGELPLVESRKMKQKTSFDAFAQEARDGIAFLEAAGCVGPGRLGELLALVPIAQKWEFGAAVYFAIVAEAGESMPIERLREGVEAAAKRERPPHSSRGEAGWEKAGGFAQATLERRVLRAQSGFSSEKKTRPFDPASAVEAPKAATRRI
jgi:hypothetical protein